MATPLEKAVAHHLGEAHKEIEGMRAGLTRTNARIDFVNACIAAAKEWTALGVVIDIPTAAPFAYGGENLTGDIDKDLIQPDTGSIL